MNGLSEMIIYTTEDGLTKVDVNFDGDTVWLTQEQMAELFQKAKSTISEHISNVYEEGELDRESTMRKFGISRYHGIHQYHALWFIVPIGHGNCLLQFREHPHGCQSAAQMSARRESHGIHFLGVHPVFFSMVTNIFHGFRCLN